jgi:hypothetical protein
LDESLYSKTNNTMSSRTIWASAAVIVAAILIPVSMSAYYDLQSVIHGSLVIVRVTDLPTSSGDLKFSYNGQIYDKDVPDNVHLNLNVGDSIQLKYSNAANGHFLFPGENPMTWNLIAIGIAFILVVAFIYYASRKEPPPIIIFGKKSPPRSRTIPRFAVILRIMHFILSLQHYTLFIK